MIEYFTMKTVFLFVSNFVYSSDFLRTEYIKYLSQNYRVIVLIPPQAFCSDNKEYFMSDNIEYIKWNVQSPVFWNIFGKYLRYSLIRQYDFEPVVIRNKAKGMRGWKRKILGLVSFLAPKSFWTNDLFTKLEMILAPESKIFNNLVKKYNPSIVLTATPGFSHLDAEAIILSKRAGIKTASINFSWDNLHNGGMHFRRPDYLIVWNNIIKNTAVNEYGYSAGNVFVSGVMRFDTYFTSEYKKLSRREFLISKNLDPDRKTILITTVTKGNYPDEDKVLDDLLRARSQGRFGDEPNIFVRMHPKEDFSKFQAYSSGKIRNLHVEYPGKLLSEEMGTRIEIGIEDMSNLKNTLMYSDVVINYVSTMTLESFIFSKPVVNIDYPEKYHNAYHFRHYKPIVDYNAVFLAKSFDQLVDSVNECLKNPEVKIDCQNKVLDEFIYFKDGLSFKRNVDFLKEII